MSKTSDLHNREKRWDLPQNKKSHSTIPKPNKHMRLVKPTFFLEIFQKMISEIDISRTFLKPSSSKTTKTQMKPRYEPQEGMTMREQER